MADALVSLYGEIEKAKGLLSPGGYDRRTWADVRGKTYGD